MQTGPGTTKAVEINDFLMATTPTDSLSFPLMSLMPVLRVLASMASMGRGPVRDEFKNPTAFTVLQAQLQGEHLLQVPLPHLAVEQDLETQDALPRV